MIVCTEEVDNRDILGFRGSLVQKALFFNIIVSDPSPLESRPVQSAELLAAVSAEFQFIEHTRRQVMM